MNTSVHHLLPWEWANFYDELRPFLAHCGGFGLYVEMTVFTQAKTLMPSLAQQQEHYDRVVTSLGDAFCFVEGVNEYNVHDNATDPGLRFWKPDGARFDLCAGSQAGGDEVPMPPVCDSIRYHSNDQSEWQRKQAHNPMEMSWHNNDDAALANENMRTDKDPNAYRHQDAAAGAALLHAGSYIHSPEGKQAVPFGASRPCAEAFMAGVRSIDLSQRVFPYQHRTDLETPDVIRAYQRGSQIVLIRK